MTDGSFSERVGHLWRQTTHREEIALVGCLGVLVVVRLIPLPSVYQNGTVALSGNDPYAYRHAVEVLVHGDATPWSLPNGVASGEPLLVTTLWVASLLLGGSQWAVDTVVAWYPVLSALVTGYLVYAITVRASADPRIGLAAVLLLAVTPAHAFRTSLGFADHHAFDYLWLALTVYALVVLLTADDRGRVAPLPVGLLGIGVAGQLLAWEAGPLLLVPLAIAVPVGATGFVDGERTELLPLASVPIGIGFGTILTSLVHYGLGWHARSVVIVSGALFVGSLGVLALVWYVREVRRSWPALVVLEIAALATGFLIVSSAFPEILSEFSRGLERLLLDTRIGEMSSLIEDYGAVLGPLILLGFAPFLAIPAVVMALRDTFETGNLAWPVVIVYAIYFTALATTQRRFGGELAPFLAILGGFGMVGLLSWLNLVRWPDNPTRLDTTLEPTITVPDRTRLVLLGGVIGVFTGTGTLYTGLINGRVVTDRDGVRAAQWMREYAGERGWTYPDNFVLSEWGRNRMFNYFVNGRSASYGYAQRYYEDFLFTSDAQGWYEQFVDRVGFVVVRDFEYVDSTNPFLMYARLRQFGSAGDRSPGLGHYRAVYASPDREYIVFTLVPGATVTGTIQTEAEITTTVSIPHADFEYVRQIEPSDDGSFAVTVAQPGTYHLNGQEFIVSERSVREGNSVKIE